MNPDWLLPLRRIAPHLPEAPAGFVVCQTLNLAVRRLWPDEDFMWLQGKTARLAVSDLGCGVTLSYTGGRFIHSSKAADVTLRAELAALPPCCGARLTRTRCSFSANCRSRATPNWDCILKKLAGHH